MGRPVTMDRPWTRALPAIIVALLGLTPSGDANAQNPGAKRVPWTTSRVVGSPEPPPPYRVERAFPKLVFRNPVLMTMAPGGLGSRFFVAEQGGKIRSFRDDPNAEKTDELIDLSKDVAWDKSTIAGFEALYALAFHPQFAKNRYCYICYVVRGTKPGPMADGTRVSRFKVTDTDPPTIDPKSETLLLTWLAGGHNGSDLQFGNDGYLYISTGDATDPIPPDRLDTGQDISDLLSSILRIDVDHESPATGKTYAIPADNPFVKTPNARPEVWAYGFRNPWRMSFDRPTGDLWVGDVGWEMWEMIFRVKAGGNYGWSVMEGPQAVRPSAKRGPTPISPPNVALPHTESASITGGYVYRGKRLKELSGAYVFGDWVTRKLWAARFDGDKLASLKELTQDNQRIIAFCLDRENELYFLHYDEAGTIHRLVPNDSRPDASAGFPRQLSQTGLFESVPEQRPAPGVIPFAIRAEQWSDHATAERFLAMPGAASARIFDRFVPVPETFFSSQVFFPPGTVLAKTLSMEMNSGQPSSRKRLETQILLFDGRDWSAYTYAWNDKQTDAELVPASGSDRSFVVKDATAPKGQRSQTWHFASRSQCITCHNPWTGYALAFNPLQLNLPVESRDENANQIEKLRDLGFIEIYDATSNGPSSTLPATHLTNPYADTGKFADRARSYLHVNCSHCHQANAGGAAMIDVRATLSLPETKTVDVTPVQGSFQIPSARIVAAGDPYRSVLYYRMAKTGAGRMPHIGSDLVDRRGLALIHDWIAQLSPEVEKSVIVQGENVSKSLDRISHAKDPADRAGSCLELQKLLGDTSQALMVAEALDRPEGGEALRSAVLAEVKTSASPEVRDLFERFLPDSERVKRLGTAIDPAKILATKGDPAVGRELFFQPGTLQCATCHRVENKGGNLGPDLSGVGKKYTREQILEHILQPSKLIAPEFATYTVETNEGTVATGLLASRDAKEIVLRSAPDKEVRIASSSIAGMKAQATSSMPEMLLRALTLEQAAALVDFLATLRAETPSK